MIIHLWESYNFYFPTKISSSSHSETCVASRHFMNSIFNNSSIETSDRSSISLVLTRRLEENLLLKLKYQEATNPSLIIRVAEGIGLENLASERQ